MNFSCPLCLCYSYIRRFGDRTAASSKKEFEIIEVYIVNSEYSENNHNWRSIAHKKSRKADCQVSVRGGLTPTYTLTVRLPVNRSFFIGPESDHAMLVIN